MAQEFNLLLTLGHNSSAIIISGEPQGNYKIICGYEEERLSKHKSDSCFPELAIRRCLEVAGTKIVEGIYVTHWAIDGELSSMSKKHWRPDLLPDHMRLVSLSHEFTHHDAHAETAEWYAFAKSGLNPANTMILVVDGFGNFGEHMSIYQCVPFRHPKLVRRLFGYGGSMGLMYQYMTGFLGMKQHEDEYKILGYEAHINEVDVDMGLLHELINKEITSYLDGYFDAKQLVDPYDAMVRLDALPALQKSYVDKWTKMVNHLDLAYVDEKTKRIVMGYFVQSVLEGVVASVVKIYQPHNLIATGGVFYNVKLSRKLLDMVPGKLCVCPLAGDQGNALGLFMKDENITWPGHLNWGIRPQASSNAAVPNGLVITRNQYQTAEACMASLGRFGMVNLVRGAMEFGPRAMCNTSTIAKPDPAIINQINRMNGRNTVMPMAPVMERATYKAIMQLTDKVHHSEEHMIISLPYKDHTYTDILGVVHQYQNEATGRPQVLENDAMMDQLFRAEPVLVNTSFNIHGRPIVYSYEDAVYCSEYQSSVGLIPTVFEEEEK